MIPTKEDDIKRFLLKIGFTEMSVEYMHILACMVECNITGHGGFIRESYAHLQVRRAKTHCVRDWHIT